MTAPDTPIEKLTRIFIKMRDAKAKLSAEFKEEEAKLVAQMDQIKAVLLDYCKEHSFWSSVPQHENAVLDKRLGVYGEVCCGEQLARVS
jgi:hypothetical protein